jgi:formate/nitrite transporter FocA (FNT family)
MDLMIVLALAMLFLSYSTYTIIGYVRGSISHQQMIESSGFLTAGGAGVLLAISALVVKIYS